MKVLSRNPDDYVRETKLDLQRGESRGRDGGRAALAGPPCAARGLPRSSYGRGGASAARRFLVPVLVLVGRPQCCVVTHRNVLYLLLILCWRLIV